MRYRCASALALLLASGPAWAGDKPLYQRAPDWVKPAPPVDASKLDGESPLVLVVDQQQRLHDGQVWAYTDGATRIASAQTLNQAGTLQLPWQPADGDLIIHRVEILRGNERIDALAKGDRFTVLRREEQLEQLQLTGILTATMTVEGLRVGDVLRVAFSTTNKDAALAGNVQTVVPLVSEPLRVGFARTRLLWDAGTAVKWDAHGKGPQPKPVRTGAYQELEVVVPLAKADELPADAPMRFRRLDILEATSFADWQAVSRTMEPLYRTSGLIAPGSPLAAEVARIKAAHAAPSDRTAAALRLVQDEVRYLFNGMAGGNYHPQSPSDTWQRRYGDCKAKTLLLLALLHALDVEAEPVLASIGMGDLVAGRLPSAAAFNHVIVRATVDGRTLWLDGTDSGTRRDDLGDAPPFRTVLPVRAAGAELMPVPLAAPARPQLAATIEIDQTAGYTLPIAFKASITLRGAAGQEMSLAASQADRQQKDEGIGSVLSGYLDSALIVDRDIRWDAASGIATITASGIATNPWAREDQRLRLWLDRSISRVSFEPDRSRAAWQSLPVATNGPSHIAITTRVRLPDGGKGVTLGGDRTLPGRYAGLEVDRKVTLEGDLLVAQDDLRADGAEVPVAGTAEQRARVAQAKGRLLAAVAPDNRPARWQEVTAARRDKRLTALEAAYAKDVAANPDSAESFERRARFREGVFDWRGALADLDRAIALGATASRYVWRAGLYQQVKDDAKALADLKAAEALEPDSIPVQLTLAQYEAEHGEAAAALARVDGQKSTGGEQRNQLQLVHSDVLAAGGRVDDALATLDGVIKTSPGQAMLLNGRCWIKGTRNVALESALRDCTKAIELAESPSSMLDSRGMVYFRMNRLDEALADFDAALEMSPGLPAPLFMRAVVRKAKGDAAGSAADLAAATLQSPRIAEKYAGYGIKL
jgi:transglutaminase-like putative cysteine protease/tetratricopeptide (TPR) repeat protein